MVHPDIEISMNRSIVQDNYSLHRDIERESVKIVHNLVCVDEFFFLRGIFWGVLSLLKSRGVKMEYSC